MLVLPQAGSHPNRIFQELRSESPFSRLPVEYPKKKSFHSNYLCKKVDVSGDCHQAKLTTIDTVISARPKGE